MKIARCLLASTLLAFAIDAGAARAQETAPTDDLRAVLEMYRSDLNAAKAQTLNSVMRLDEREAAKFWPLYRQYEAEFAALGDRKVVLVREFVTLSATGNLDDKSSARIAERWLDLQADRLALWKRYYEKIARAVSPLRGGQFLQIEHQVALFVDLNIASEMPVVGTTRR